MTTEDTCSRRVAGDLGWAYLVGERLPVDYPKARAYLEAAAAGGCPASMGMLGFMMLLGLGGETDEVRGYEWINTAAEMGEPGAHLGLAARYGQGVGVPYQPARALGHLLVAKRAYGGLSGLEELLREDLTPQEVEEAEELAAEWAPSRC